jgi:ABC-type uncharacterized transport system permease subunit
MLLMSALYLNYFDSAKYCKHLQGVRVTIYMALAFILLQVTSRSSPYCNCWKKRRNIALGNPINLIHTGF